MYYVIRKSDEVGDEPLYWSNADGWVDRQSASILHETEREGVYYLPIAGVWEAVKPEFSDRELATVLAALRQWTHTGMANTCRATYEHYQRNPDRAPYCPMLSDIASNGQEFIPLDSAEIDALCERLNCPPAPQAKKPSVLIEVTGGVAHYSVDGDVDVTLVDYDNGDTLEEEEELEFPCRNCGKVETLATGSDLCEACEPL